MSKDIMERIFKMIQKKLEKNEFDELRLAFFGGEPLTNFDFVAYPLAKKIKEMVMSKQKRFFSFFVTNASLITPQMINQFKEINPYFQITLDGNRKKHDTVRIWEKDGSPTYTTIINAIKQITSEIYNEKYPQPILTLRINYDNNTLKHITEIIDDIYNVNRKSLFIYFERVWQTRHLINDEQKTLLMDTLKTFIDNDFRVGHGGFGIKNVACPAETSDFVIINYDGFLYRCNGRTLSPETKEGELLEDGTIVWDENIKAKRLGLSTFENSKCLNCIMLPQCIGPCSQKIIEQGCVNDNNCTFSSMDISLEDYLKIEFEMKYYYDLKNPQS